MTKLPRLLDNNLREVKRLHPLSLSITEKLVPLSYASMKLLKDEMLTERRWVELYSPIGSVGIYRTRSPQEGVGQENYTVELEHGCTEIGDYLINDSFSGEMTCRQAITKIFGYYRGNKWKLGSIACTATVNVDFDFDNVLESIISVLDQTVDYVMAFDFSTTPWTFSIVHKQTSVTAEGRLSRNVQSAVIKRDDTDLCTRVYVDGLPGANGKGYIDADTKATYGIIEHEESGDYTEAQARRVAETYLRNHKTPKVSVEINAIDLSEITGEELDKFAVGKMYRLALPDYNETVEEIVTQISWSDVFNRQKEATVSLGDSRDPVISFYKEASSTAKETKRSGKSSRKTVKMYNTKFEQTDYAITMWAGKTDINGEILEQAGLELDSSGVLIYADDGKENRIGSKFRVTKEAIEAEVKARSEQGENLSTRINQNANDITLTVKKGDVATQLAVEAGNVSVRNGNLIVDGMVTATAVKTAVADIKDLTVGGVIRATNYYLGTGAVPVTIGAGVYDIDITRSGNTYTLKKQTFNNPSWVDVRTFSRAVSSASWTWTGGAAKVTVQPQAQSFTSPAFDSWTKQGNPSYNSSTKIVSQNFVMNDENGNTMFITNCNISASDAYNAGKEDASHTSPQYNSVNSVNYFSASGGTSQKSELFYRLNGTYYSAGSHYWYRRDSYMSPTTYYA